MTWKRYLTAIKQGLAAGGWLYAFMVTGSEAFGWLSYVPWYEKLGVVLFLIFIYGPVVIWVRMSFGKSDNLGNEEIEAGHPTSTR